MDDRALRRQLSKLDAADVLDEATPAPQCRYATVSDIAVVIACVARYSSSSSSPSSRGVGAVVPRDGDDGDNGRWCRSTHTHMPT